MKKKVMTITSMLLAILFVGCAMNKSIHIPAGEGDLERVRAEIDGGKDVNSKDIAGQTALMYASEQGRLEVVKYLVENGADVNVQSGVHGRGTALIYASIANRIAVMEYLLDHKADINATTHFEETALHWAAAKGQLKAVNLLIMKNADTELKNKAGKTALDLAKEFNRKEIEIRLSGQ